MGYDVIVIGGGAIGLACARALAPDRSVLLLERGEVGKESSWAAAGMLCPHSEASAHDALMRLSIESVRIYREFVEELFDETGVDSEYLDHGTLVLGSTPDQWCELQRRFEWQQRAKLVTDLLEPREVRRMEPSLTLDIEGALFCPGDHQVRPRRLLEALVRSCSLRGVEVLERVLVEDVLEHAGRIKGVRAGSREFAAPNVIVAAGAWASKIRGLNPQVETGPRKGQILALKMPGPVFSRVIRWQEYYFVPRKDGSLVVGATNEDAGFDRSLTVSGLSSLLNTAAKMSSAVSDYPVVESWTGLRPLTTDGLPAIGTTSKVGLFYAFGHYRNGILLAPVTARILRALLAGDSPPPVASEVSPMRFTDEPGAL